MWKCCVAVSIHQKHFVPRDTLDIDSDSRLGVIIEVELGTELETKLDEKKERVDVKLTLEDAFIFAIKDLGSGMNANQ